MSDINFGQTVTSYALTGGSTVTANADGTYSVTDSSGSAYSPPSTTSDMFLGSGGPAGKPGATNPNATVQPPPTPPPGSSGGGTTPPSPPAGNSSSINYVQGLGVTLNNPFKLFYAVFNIPAGRTPGDVDVSYWIAVTPPQNVYVKNGPVLLQAAVILNGPQDRWDLVTEIVDTTNQSIYTGSYQIPASAIATGYQATAFIQSTSSGAAGKLLAGFNGLPQTNITLASVLGGIDTSTWNFCEAVEEIQPPGAVYTRTNLGPPQFKMTGVYIQDSTGAYPPLNWSTQQLLTSNLAGISCVASPNANPYGTIIFNN